MQKGKSSHSQIIGPLFSQKGYGFFTSKQKVCFVIAIVSFMSIVKSQEIFLEDINGDGKKDVLSITQPNMKDLIIKQSYTGHQLWKFDFLNEFEFNGSQNFDSYKIADMNGDGRANLITFLDDGNNKNVWFFKIEPKSLSYIGHTLLISASETKEHFADINGDGKKELLLIKDVGTSKYIDIYTYTNGDFVLNDSFTSSGNPKEEHFADINGDSKDDLILSQDLGGDKRIWTFNSNGTTFEYLAYTNLASNAGKDVSFLNSNSTKDNYFDLVLSANTPEGKKFWLYESDGARFEYEITNTFEDGNNREILFGDIDGNGTDDVIATDIINSVWSYENIGNVFTYKLFTSLSYNNIIPENRLLDWNHAGYNKGTTVPTSFSHFVSMPPPSSDPSTNYSNFQTKLSEAVNLKVSFPNQHIAIVFQNGSYTFNEPIRLNFFDDHSSIVLQGQGAVSEPMNGQSTELIYNIDPTPSQYGKHFININGSLRYPTNSSEAPIVMNYNSETNEVTLDKTLGTFNGQDYLVELLFTNGLWHDMSNFPTGHQNVNEYVGFITSASLVSGTTYKLEKDFSLTWDLFKDSTNEAKAYKFLPIKEIGLKNLSLRYSDEFENVNKDGITSSMVSINRAENCWLDNVEISKVLSGAVGVHESRYVEVRNSYFHEAYGYGGGGRAYGVVIGNRSIHCKAENNVFRKFRHAMMVQHGSNHNVFGYNYSREQTDQLGNILGDLNLHGYQPYGNLFEGNRVDRIDGDATFGPNGPFNTFFRNYTFYNKLKIHKMQYANIIGNENAISEISDDLQTTFQFYEYIYDIYDDGNLQTQHNYLPDESYYLDVMPNFFSPHMGVDVSWPAIGPPLLLEEDLIQNIPARIRWFNLPSSNNLKASFQVMNSYLDDEIVVSPNPVDDGILSLKIPNLSGDYNIRLYDFDGRLLTNKSASPTSLDAGIFSFDVSHLKTGMYLISINSSKGVVTKKIFIK